MSISGSRDEIYCQKPWDEETYRINYHPELNKADSMFMSNSNSNITRENSPARFNEYWVPGTKQQKLKKRRYIYIAIIILFCILVLGIIVFILWPRIPSVSFDKLQLSNDNNNNKEIVINITAHVFSENYVGGTVVVVNGMLINSKTNDSVYYSRYDIIGAKSLLDIPIILRFTNTNCTIKKEISISVVVESITDGLFNVISSNTFTENILW